MVPALSGMSCLIVSLGPFIRGKIRSVLHKTRLTQDANCTIYTSMSYLIRRVLAKPRLILEEMYRLYGTFASYLRRVLCKTRLIFPRMNGPIVSFKINSSLVLSFTASYGKNLNKINQTAVKQSI